MLLATDLARGRWRNIYTNFKPLNPVGECFVLHTQIGRVMFLPRMNVNCKTKPRQTANDLYTGLAQLVIRVEHLGAGYCWTVRQNMDFFLPQTCQLRLLGLLASYWHL